MQIKEHENEKKQNQMAISMASFSSPHPLPPTPLSSSTKTHNSILKYSLCFTPKRSFPLLSAPKASSDNGSSPTATTVEIPAAATSPERKEAAIGDNSPVEEIEMVSGTKFEEPRWIGGTWDLKQFIKDGKTDWDAVIDAEVKRRKWLENSPETTTNDDPVLFDTNIIPWWAWTKRFHLPEAELLNGRAAMVGFFMAYLVDSLTGVGLVDQMSNFFCKTLLFVAVAGVLFIRKNEDVDKLKKLFDETTFYDKQWQATWVDDKSAKK